MSQTASDDGADRFDPIDFPQADNTLDPERPRGRRAETSRDPADDVADAANPLATAWRRTRVSWRLAGFFGLCAGALSLLPAFFAYEIFDRILGDGLAEPRAGLGLETSAATELAWCALFAAGAIGVAALLDAARGQVMSRTGAWLEKTLAEPALARAFEQRLRDGSRSGALEDLAAVRDGLAGATARGLTALPAAALALGALVWLHPALALPAAAAVLAAGASILWRGGFGDAGARLERFAAAVAAQLSGAMRNAEVVRALGLWPAMADRARDPGERAVAAARDLGDRRAFRHALIGALRPLALFLSVALGAALMLQGAIAPAAFAAALLLVGPATAPVFEIALGWAEWARGRRARRRLLSLFDAEAPPAGGRTTPIGAGAGSAAVLEVEDASYRATPEGPALLDGVSFSVGAGETLGIVGRSGAGKSTLCRLIVGALRPERGAVRIDGAEIGDWDPDALGASLGYLPQHVELFDGRVNENIARMADVRSVQTLEAARTAAIHEVVQGLPDGYDFFVGPGGGRLSAGHRQRVALARALFGAPSLVVLDEPNAHLDQAGEKALLDTLIELKARGAATVLVSHRPALLARADRLVVLREGRMVLSGERERILRELYGAGGRGAAEPQPDMPETLRAAFSASVPAPGE